MILILISTIICLLNHFELLSLFEWYIGLPLYIHLIITAVLAITKSLMVITQYYPTVVRVLTALDIWSRKPDSTAPSVPFNNNNGQKGVVGPKGQTRGFSTSAVRGRERVMDPTSPRGLDIKTSNPSLYARLLNTIKPVNAMISVKGGRPLANHLLRMVSLIGLEKSLGLVKVILTFLNFCFKYIQNNGLSGLVIYLKACTVILQQASGRHRLKDMNGLKIRFARTGQGYPRVIPRLHRSRLHEPKVFKLWMTLFAIYRVLEVPGVLKLNTITDPSRMDPYHVPLFTRYLSEEFWISLLSLKGVDNTKFGEYWGEPLEFMSSLRAKPFIISKASSAAGTIKILPTDVSVLSTSPAALLATVACWVDNPQMFAILKDWCNITKNTWLLNRIDSWNRILVPICDPARSPELAALTKGMRTVLGPTYARALGRLGFKEEAAGKVRAFAYVDAFTQWLMKPLHDAIFELLALIPQDGTLNQMAPIKRLLETKPKGPFYSFDLSAATDRLPLIIQKALLSPFMTSWGATLWGNMLVGREYEYYYKNTHTQKVSKGTVVYGTGQPMGALSSWAMLALTHHGIVQMAAINTGKIKPGEWFEDYAVLGDDIVIADADVAEEYQRLMRLLGVEIGLAKSLISLDGQTLEFAKRTIHRGHDVSPVPFSEYWIARQQLSSSLELVKKYSLSLARYLDLFGFGYKAKGSITGDLMSLGRKLRHRVIAYFSPFGPNPISFRDFFAMKGLGRFYKWTERKGSALVSEFILKELNRLLDRLNDSTMIALEENVKLLSTVNKDREFYGTLSREAPGARKIDLAGLTPWKTHMSLDPLTKEPIDVPLDKDLYYHVIDDLCQTVYRETFLDVRVELRELRYAIEDAIKAKSGPTLDDLEDVIRMYHNFQQTLSHIPLPKEIYNRVEAEARISQLELIKHWEVYSRFLRSTLSK